MNFIVTGERVLITLWVGGLWAIGYIAAPTLFAMLDDRRLAGEVAGQLFHIINFLGLGCGGVLLVGMLWRGIARWQLWVIIVTLVIVGCSQFLLQPVMEHLKVGGLVEGSEQAREFGQLHGVSEALYLVNSLLGLVLVIFGMPEKEPRLFGGL
jgi:hypothetical protein